MRSTALVPKGGALPEDVWRSRHRGILLLLLLHVPGLFVFALARGRNPLHGLIDVTPIAGLWLIAHRSRHRRQFSTIVVSVGLMLSSAVLVHLSGGVIEAHFHFLVMVGVVVLYQDWLPFLVAIAFVVLHHGVMGALAPHDVYNHPDAWAHPWRWAGIHGASILAMSVVGIANWKLNERFQSQLGALAAIVDSSEDAIYGWAVDGAINSWNRAAAEHFLYFSEEIIGRPLATLIPPSQAANWDRIMERILLGERIEPFDSQRIRKDGTSVEVSLTISAVRDHSGAIVGGATIARDITARRRGEVDLQQTLSLLESTLESMAGGILVVHLDGSIARSNGKFAEMWNIPNSVLASGDDQAALTFVLDQVEDPAAFVARVEELYLQPEMGSSDTLHFKDGRVFERSSRPQRVGGAVVGRVWSFHDVTDRRRMESDLAEARDQALETSRLKSEFLATMSHEIRTPMNGVIGLTGLLLDTDLTDCQREYADGVRHSGEALLSIINDILDFSKIEAGKLELEIVDFDLAEALDEVAGLVAEAARVKGLELVAYCLPDVPTRVRGDVGRLRQILLNLVSNAVKFTAVGEVVLRATLADPAGAGNVSVRLEVCDTGIGVDHDTAERIFEPFQQADASTTRRYGGTGLGLAICRRLAEAMGGTIGVDSDLGHGATFWLDLTFAAANQPAAVSTPDERPLHGLRVLVVDDNQTNRLVLASQLLAWDITADLACDGLSAIDHLNDAAAASRPYDLVLTDMAMPGMDGLELARTIKADPSLASARMLLLSSIAVDAEAVTEAGFSMRLTKPARRSQLYDALLRTVSPPAVDVSRSTPAPRAPVVATRGRLLIVEDNTINQVVAKGILAQLGYSSDLAGNGIEALDAIERRRYDAVLMDCQMPGMDGFEATAEIRRRETAGSPPVPIIAMTAGALAEDRERCLAAGMNDYMSKPVKRQDLERVLDHWLPATDDTPLARVQPA